MRMIKEMEKKLEEERLEEERWKAEEEWQQKEEWQWLEKEKEEQEKEEKKKAEWEWLDRLEKKWKQKLVVAWANEVAETAKKSKQSECSKAGSLKLESLQGQSSRPEEEMGDEMEVDRECHGCRKQKMVCTHTQDKFLLD